MPKTLLTTAAVLKLRAGPHRREIPDGGARGLSLVIQPSGAKSWAMRFRRPDGKSAKLTLGPVDLTGEEAEAEPKLGSPLTLTGARRLASEVHRQRALGRDVVGDTAAEKRRRQHAFQDAAQNTFALAARDYVEQERRSKEHNRGWRNTAKVLGLAYPEEAREPVLVKGGLAERWQDKPIGEVTADDVHVLVEEAGFRAIPGQRPRRPGPSDSRARDMAAALQTMFKWLVRRRRIKSNPCIDLDKPGPARARDRILNVNSAKPAR